MSSSIVNVIVIMETSPQNNRFIPFRISSSYIHKKKPHELVISAQDQDNRHIQSNEFNSASIELSPYKDGIGTTASSSDIQIDMDSSLLPVNN